MIKRKLNGFGFLKRCMNLICSLYADATVLISCRIISPW